MVQITRSLQSAGASVDILSLNPRRQHASADVARGALAPATLADCEIDTSAPWRAAWNAASNRLPILVSRFYSRGFARMIVAKLASAPCDVVHLEGQYLLPYVPAIRAATSAPIVLRAQNVEFQTWEGLARNAVLRRLTGALQRWEIAHLDDCDAIAAISREDATTFRTLGATRPIGVIPCGVSIGNTTATGDPRHFYFVGSMLYRPNQQAVRWLARELWPRVRAAHPDARLTVGGSSFPEDLRDEVTAAGIAVVGDFESIAAFSAPFGVMLAPLFSGSGMRIKVLEAMALGKAVIANPLGVGGIDITDGEDVLLAKDTGAFAARIGDCLNDPGLVPRIGSAARRLVVERYSTEQIGRDLLDFYRSL